MRKDTNRKSLTLGPKELPVTFDVLRTIVHFCFPGNTFYNLCFIVKFYRWISYWIITTRIRSWRECNFSVMSVCLTTGVRQICLLETAPPPTCSNLFICNSHPYIYWQARLAFDWKAFCSYCNKLIRIKSVLYPNYSFPLKRGVLKLFLSYLLSHLCFRTDGLYAQKSKPSDSVHYLVLTDVNGVRTYATCLTYYRSFIAQQVQTKYHGVNNHFGGSLISSRVKLDITEHTNSYGWGVSISPRMVKIPKIFSKKNDFKPMR